MTDVDAWRSRQEARSLAAIDVLRNLVREAGESLTESIKWNAPSFAYQGQDRITLGVERKGGVRVVLHRGVAKTDDDFHFDDPEGLARWAAPDRGVLTFPDAQTIAAESERLVSFFRCWLRATS